MTFLEKMDRINRRLSGWFELIGLGGLLVMMVITCLDVFGGKLFRTPVYGALDIVMLGQLVAVSFATAYAHQVRLEAADLEDAERLAAIAAAGNLTPEQVRERFSSIC